MDEPNDLPHVVRVRLSESLMEQVDRRLARLRAELPGVSSTQSDVIRDVLHKGFEALAGR